MPSYPAPPEAVPDAAMKRSPQCGSCQTSLGPLQVLGRSCRYCGGSFCGNCAEARPPLRMGVACDGCFSAAVQRALGAPVVRQGWAMLWCGQPVARWQRHWAVLLGGDDPAERAAGLPLPVATPTAAPPTLAAMCADAARAWQHAGPHLRVVPAEATSLVGAEGSTLVLSVRALELLPNKATQLGVRARALAFVVLY